MPVPQTVDRGVRDLADVSASPGLRTYRQATSLRLSPRSQSSRRSILEIRMDILRVIRDGANRPTQIMFRANLSWSSMCPNLDVLVGRSLVNWFTEGSRRVYGLTPKGQQLVSAFECVRGEVEDGPLLVR